MEPNIDLSAPSPCENGSLEGTWPCGVTWFEAGEAGPTPTALAAVTVKMYPMPLVSPVTVQGEFKKKTMTSTGKPVTDANILQKINEGGNGMPAYKDILSDAEKANVIAYLKTL